MSARVYHHEFTNVEDYLHQRDPYLMVDGIEEIGDRSVVAIKQVTGDEFFIDGHFPGTSVVPGAMMQEMTTQSAGILIAARFNPMAEFNTHEPFFNEYALGVLVRVKDARFRSFARPGDILTIRVELTDQLGTVFNFDGAIESAGKVIMKNSFQLMNIASETLQGVKDEAACLAT